MLFYQACHIYDLQVLNLTSSSGIFLGILISAVHVGWFWQVAKTDTIPSMIWIIVTVSIGTMNSIRSVLLFLVRNNLMYVF